MSTEKLETEVEVLDREAREAMSRLVSKREELQEQLASTELAAERQREHQEERRRAKEEEAAKKAEEQARARSEELSEKLAELGRRREEVTQEIADNLDEHERVHHELAQVVNSYDGRRAKEIARSRVEVRNRWADDAIRRWLR